MNERAAAPPPSTSGPGRYASAAGTVSRIALPAERFVVADVTAGAVRSDIVGDGTKRGALVALKRYLAVHPEAAGTIQLLRDDEVGA
jgi:hypothetical protein